MRIYYFTLTLFLQTLSLIAQPADVVALSSEQIALVQSQGAYGIQTIFEELEIEIQDLPSVEAFAQEVALSQLTSTSSEKEVTEIASSVTIALARIASSENTYTNYVLEYASAGIAHGTVLASEKNNLDISRAIISSSKGSVSGAIKFSKNLKINIDKIMSAVASGYLAGTIEASNQIGLDVIKSVEASANGLIVGTIDTALKNDIKVYKTLASTCEGIAEAAIEASVREQLDIIKQITAASISAGESAVESANEFSIEIPPTQKAILDGLKRGIKDSIPGKGNNVRIMIAPLKDIIPAELINAAQKGIFQGGLSAGYLPIVETPSEFDPTIGQVSPEN